MLERFAQRIIQVLDSGRVDRGCIPFMLISVRSVWKRARPNVGMA